MSRRRRWGREQIDESLADLGDLTSRLNGSAEAAGKEPAPPRQVKRPSAVEEQLEGLAELAAELDLGLPGARPAPGAGEEHGATNGIARATGPERASAPGSFEAAPVEVAPVEPPPVDDQASPPPRTLTEPAPGVLILARPASGRSEVRGRPWSLAAAMEPLPPLAPPAPPPRPAAAPPPLVGDPGDPEHAESGGRRLRLTLAIATGAALLIAAVVTAILLLGHPTTRASARPPARPTPTAAPAGFGIDRLRTVSATASDPFSAPSLNRFVEGSASIVVDVTYHGASPGTPLGINLARAGGPGQPAMPVLDTSYILSPAATGEGQNAIVLATPLTQGHYVLRASYAGQPAYSGEFDVVPAPPAPSPTPSRH